MAIIWQDFFADFVSLITNRSLPTKERGRHGACAELNKKKKNNRGFQAVARRELHQYWEYQSEKE